MYEKLIRQYFNKQTSAHEKIHIEEQMEALTFFLGYSDFQQLRSRYPELSGNGDGEIILSISGKDKELTMILNDKCIDLKKE